MNIEPQWAGIISIAISCIGGWVAINKKVDKTQTLLDAHLKNNDQNRIDFKEFQGELKKDLKHLESAVGQSTTNLRIFINEGNKETNERIYQLEKATLQQIKEVHDRIDHVKDDIHNHKHEVNEKIITHLAK